MPRAQMEIWIISSKLYHNSRYIGKMSPYVNINVDKKTLKTSIAKKGGTHPTWNDVFTCTIPHVTEIEIVVMDKGFFRNRIVGSAKIEVAYILSQQRTDEDLKLYHKNKEVGFIRVVINRLNEQFTQLDSGVSMRSSQMIDAASQMQPSQIDQDEFKIMDDVVSVPSTYYGRNIIMNEPEDAKFDIVLPQNPDFKVEGGDCAFEFQPHGKEDMYEETQPSSNAFTDHSTNDNIPMLPDPIEIN